MRQIVLDTETTGLEPEKGHRVVEIGGVEVIDRKLTGQHFHSYLNPEREVDDAAYEIHGLSDKFLSSQPLFKEIASDFLSYIEDAELIIHNAPFDVAFLDFELARLKNKVTISDRCSVVDSLALARHKHPGQKNNLDALCRRYGVDNSARDLHGALLDAEILADVYLLMTGGQTVLFGDANDEPGASVSREFLRIDRKNGQKLSVIKASDEEAQLHESYLDALDEYAEDGALWRHLQD